MPGLFIVTPGARAGLESERLRLVIPPEEEDAEPITREIPLNDIDSVILTEHVNISMPALTELVRREIPVVITARGEKVVGLCLPPAPNSIARLAQYRRSADARFGLALAVNLVEAKILNSRRVLQRVAANRDEADASTTLRSLEQIAGKCVSAESLDVLRGYEGTAAGKYFKTYGAFFPDECPFERRSRQPPHNAVNAILSYAYTIMTAEMECRIHAAGLDPAIGFFHEPADRRPSLALDLIEPFRAPIADALALDVVNHGVLQARRHFEPREGGIYLNMEGRKRFYVAYERRMNREYFNEQTGKRTTLRNEFYNQTLGLKRAILDEEPFEPFVMN